MNPSKKLQIRGPIIGHCNICGKHGKLTEDHIPPKGTQKARQVDLFKIIDVLSIDRLRSGKLSRHMQGGVHYRSLCGDCNNNLLGARYDPVLINFANSIDTVLRSNLQIPDPIRIRTQPGLLARAVLGHLFAIGIERTERTHILDATRSYVQNITLPLPDGIDIYYWLYPYQRQIAIRDAALSLDFFKKHIVFWCLKFYPVGFLVTWKNEHPDQIALPRLSDYIINSGDHDADVLLPLSSIPDQSWPEAPIDSGAVLYGEGGHAAIPHNSQ